MRVLLTSYFPFSGPQSDDVPRRLAEALLSRGHEVEALIVDRDGKQEESFPVRRVVARREPSGGDLPFDFPCFESHEGSHPTFYVLTDPQTTAYREATRRALDETIHAFNPHIVHAQHVWLLGHLALEAGAPYVLSAYEVDLAAGRADGRYRRLAQEAAENAGRVIAPSDALRERLESAFGALDGRLLTIVPPQDDSREAFERYADQVIEVYYAALRDRFGPEYSPE